MHKYPSALIQFYWHWSAYGGAITKEDVQLPITARPEFAGSVVMYKAANLEAVWELVEGDPFYKEGVVRGVLHINLLGLCADYVMVGQWNRDAIKIVPVLSRA